MRAIDHYLISRKQYVLPWVICLTASLLFFYEIFQLAVFNTLSDQLTHIFYWSRATFGYVASSYLYACSIFLLPAGILLDRYSTKKILTYISLLCAIGVLLISLAHSMSLVLLGRILTGLGNAFMFLGCMRLISAWFPPNKIAFVTGLVVTIGMSGGIVAQTPFILFINWVGWREAMFFNAMGGIAITALIVLLVKDNPKLISGNLKANEKTEKFWHSLALAWRNSQNWLCGAYTGLLNLPIMILGALWGNLYLIHVREISLLQASKITSLIFIGFIIGSPLMGWISDKLGNRSILMRVSAAIILLVSVLIIYLNVSLLILASLFLLMGALSSGQILSYPVVVESNPMSIQATSLGLVAVIVNLGDACLQGIFGWIVDIHPKVVSNPYHFAMILLPAAFFLSLVIAFAIRTPTQIRT